MQDVLFWLPSSVGFALTQATPPIRTGIRCLQSLDLELSFPGQKDGASGLARTGVRGPDGTLTGH
jgi:hypothetical protein